MADFSCKYITLNESVIIQENKIPINVRHDRLLGCIMFNQRHRENSKK